MKYDISLLDGLPDVMSLEDVRVFCHISKRTARYYLQNGLIPCRINGKKTHCYSVTREQLADALERFEACRDDERSVDRFRWWCAVLRPRVKGEVGCARSHATIYEKIHYHPMFDLC